MLKVAQLKPHQRDILHIAGLYVRHKRRPPHYVVLSGGVGTLKTTAAIWLLHAHAKAWSSQYPDATYGVLAKTYRQIDRVFWREWKRNTDPDAYTYNKNEKLIRLTHAPAEITMLYADGDADLVMRGENWTGYVLEQPETWRTAAAFNEAERRTRAFGPAGGSDSDDCFARLKIFDFNAGSTDSWAYPTFIDDSARQFIGGELWKSVACDGYTWDYYENMARLSIETTPQTSIYSAEHIERERSRLDPMEFDRMYRGLWLKAEGRIYLDYTVLEAQPKASDIDEWWIGIDPGTSAEKLDADGNKAGNLGIVVVGHIRDGAPEGGRWAVLEDDLGKYSGLDALAAKLDGYKRRYGEDAYGGCVGDWQGGSGAVMRTEMPRRLDWLGSIRKPAGDKTRSKWYRVMAGVELLQEHFRTRALAIAPNARGILADMRLYCYDSSGEQPDKKGHDPDRLDALRYVWIRRGRRLDEREGDDV